MVPRSTLQDNGETTIPNLTLLTTRDASRLHTCSLVLSAANISHTVSNNSGNQWEIRVSSSDRERALHEIETYDHENRQWPPAKENVTDSFSPLFRSQGLLIAASLALFYSVTGEWSSRSEWFLRGAIDSTAILDNHEYFRLLTGLTLHADLIHILSNAFLGGFLMHYYFRILGNGIGLIALLASSTLANYLNVLGHGSGHFSVGFSTAIFSLIGILSALNFRHYSFTRPARLLLPLMAGGALLAMLGSSGERTDFGAHFYGLLTGVGTGSILGFEGIFRLRYNLRLQTVLGITGLLISFLAWHLALQ